MIDEPHARLRMWARRVERLGNFVTGVVTILLVLWFVAWLAVQAAS